MAHHAAADDRKFLEALEKFDIAAEEFDHRSHIRMAYTYLCENSTETTCRKIRIALCGFLSHIGVNPSTRYHETITRAWVMAVRHFMACTPDTTSAAGFMDANPALMDTEIMMTHYSRPVLFSEEARRSFVEPDLAPIPRYGNAEPR